MTKPKKIAKVALLIIITAVFTGCTVGASDADRYYWQAEIDLLQTRAVDLNVDTVKVATANAAGYEIAVQKNDGKGNISVISIPGAPSEHVYWIEFTGGIDKNIEFSVVERPGYGASGPGKPVTDLSEQADAVTPLLKDEPGHCNIVLGSSYAAAIAIETALKEPELVDGLVIMSGLIQRPARGARFATLAGTLLGPVINISDGIETVRRELANSAGQRRRIIDQAGTLNMPITVIHGETDKLVPIDNAYYLLRKLAANTDVEMIVVPGAGHEIMIKFPEYLYDAIYRTVKRVQAFGECAPQASFDNLIGALAPDDSGNPDKPAQSF